VASGLAHYGHPNYCGWTHGYDGNARIDRSGAQVFEWCLLCQTLPSEREYPLQARSLVRSQPATNYTKASIGNCDIQQRLQSGEQATNS
jgi:hypothetical protein